MSELSRHNLRQQMRAQRRAVPKAIAEMASQKLAEHVLHLPILKEAQHIAMYCANDAEIDPTPLFEQLHALGKDCYLPVLDVETSGHLVFVRHQLHEPLKQNRYKIPEPHISNDRIFPADKLDVVLMPLVAFDKQGGRLGMGKGYYDRTFAFLCEKVLSKPFLLGLAYAFQCVEAIDVEPWDVPLFGVVTEEGFRGF
jgi:5-formyltetrahydrofolate cyclo-ligase